MFGKISVKDILSTLGPLNIAPYMKLYMDHRYVLDVKVRCGHQNSSYVS